MILQIGGKEKGGKATFHICFLFPTSARSLMFSQSVCIILPDLSESALYPRPEVRGYKAGSA
jgi:hypothetical protein